MSYEIIYAKQFIKVGQDLFVPLIMTGSNNCYERSYNNRYKRDRSWHLDKFFTNSMLTTQTQLSEGIDKFRETLMERDNDREKDNQYSDDRFGYFTSMTMKGLGHCSALTFNRFKSFYMNGCKYALTVEQLTEHGVDVSVETGYIWYKDKEELEKKGYKFLPTEFVKTTDEFFTSYSKFKKHYEEQNKKFKKEIHFTINLSDCNENTPGNLRKEIFGINKKKNREKKSVEVDSYYTIKAPNGRYFLRKTKYGYRYVYHPYFKFINYVDADRKLKSIRYNEGYEVEWVAEKTTIYV